MTKDIYKVPSVLEGTRQRTQRLEKMANRLIEQECPNYGACTRYGGKCKQMFNLQSLAPLEVHCKTFAEALLLYDTLSPEFDFVRELRQAVEDSQQLPTVEDSPTVEGLKHGTPPPATQAQCAMCGKSYQRTGNRQRYCPACKAITAQVQGANRQRKKRGA